jgi:hypothetical protein
MAGWPPKAGPGVRLEAHSEASATAEHGLGLPEGNFARPLRKAFIPNDIRNDGVRCSSHLSGTTFQTYFPKEIRTLTAERTSGRLGNFALSKGRRPTT